MNIEKIAENLQRFQIGDEVLINAGMGDYDEGVVLGVSIRVYYIVRDEYGRTRYVGEDEIWRPAGDS